MFLFLKLVLAHFIADFILQFEELYQLKLKSILGHLLHAAVHGLTSLLIALPYMGHPGMWAFLAAITIIHLGQDLAKYFLQEKYPRYLFLIFVTDQIVHFLVLSAVFIFPISRPILGFESYPGFNTYYLDNTWTLILIVFIATSFGGSYLLHNFRKNYLSDSRKDHFITNFEILYAMIERSLITGFFLFSNHFTGPLLCPAIGILRLFSKKLRNRLDFLLSFVYAALLGLLFRPWVNP